MSKTDGSELAKIWPGQIAFGNRSIDILFEHASNHTELTKKEIKYFLLLVERPRTQSELSELCATNQANTGRAISSLTEKGLVELGEKIDGRSYSVKLTDKGKNLSDHILLGLMRKITVDFEDITEEEYRIFIKVLGKMQKSI